MDDNNREQVQPSPQVVPFSVDTLKNSQTLHIRQEIYERILMNAFPPTRKDLDDLKNAIANDDFEVIQRVAHRLKGVFYNLRIEKLGMVAEQMNEIAKAGNSKANKERIGTLREEFSLYFCQLERMFITKEH